MTIHDLDIDGLGGEPLDLTDFMGSAVLVVNVASHCGLTPQYAALQELQERYADAGFSVLGAPCNQFAHQEPDSPDEIQAFCTTNYQVTFPLTAKVDVNGPGRHPLFEQLTAVADPDGQAGDVEWNFEKFLVSPRGEVIGRFRPQVTPDAPEVITAVEAALPTWKTVTATDVKPGDLVRARGVTLTVSRIEPFSVADGMLAFIEDSPSRWLKRPTKTDSEVDVLVD